MPSDWEELLLDDPELAAEDDSGWDAVLDQVDQDSDVRPGGWADIILEDAPQADADLGWGDIAEAASDGSAGDEGAPQDLVEREAACLHLVQPEAAPQPMSVGETLENIRNILAGAQACGDVLALGRCGRMLAALPEDARAKGKSPLFDAAELAVARELTASSRVRSAALLSDMLDVHQRKVAGTKLRLAGACLRLRHPSNAGPLDRSSPCSTRWALLVLHNAVAV